MKNAKIMLSGDQPGLFGALHGLCPAAGRELVEEPAGVRLHRVLADEQLFGDLAVAESGGDGLEDLEFPGGDAELLLGVPRSG